MAALLSLGATTASAATLSRSVDVAGNPDAIWKAIGPFCAIRNWHPAIGRCAVDGKAQPTRTLTTKDGKATFVELQTARNDAAHSYSYSFTSSPVPVTHYVSTFKVVAKSKGVSTVTWSSVYTPDRGKEQAALDALTGIYESGLAAIRAQQAN
ncbi:MAG TPA: SRPBCC family protein [Phenylobacterium sp.]|nr:SRPBCC family protein [Phenylobacterium sp.]